MVNRDDAPDVDPSVEGIVWGGYWVTADSTSGQYRLIQTQQGWEEVRHRVFIQWIDETEPPNKIRVSKELTGDGIFSVVDPTIVSEHGRWYVEARASSRPMEEFTRNLRFEIGAPGVVRDVSPP